MTAISRIARAVGRFLRAVGRELAAVIRWGAPRGAIAQGMDPTHASGVPPSIAGAIAVGEGRRVGAETNDGATTERQPD